MGEREELHRERWPFLLPGVTAGNDGQCRLPGPDVQHPDRFDHGPSREWAATLLDLATELAQTLPPELAERIAGPCERYRPQDMGALVAMALWDGVSTANFQFLESSLLAPDSADPAPVTPGPVRRDCRVRCDGLYLGSGNKYSSLLRFFEDGRVVSTSVDTVTRRQIDGIATWLTPDSPGSHGHVDLERSDLCFTLTSSSGRIDYVGEVLPSGDLLLRIHSHINGHRGTTNCEFCPVTVGEGSLRLRSRSPLHAGGGRDSAMDLHAAEASDHARA